jgi:hypothetical protein
MRMGTFLLGGIVGAIAVVYFNRNNSMLMSNISQAGQSVGNMMNKARNTISNTDMMTSSSNNSRTSGMNTSTSGMNANTSNQNANTSNQNANSSNQNANSGVSTASGKTSDHLSKVETIVKNDPNLKNKVDEILKENKQSTSAYGTQ